MVYWEEDEVLLNLAEPMGVASSREYANNSAIDTFNEDSAATSYNQTE